MALRPTGVLCDQKGRDFAEVKMTRFHKIPATASIFLLIGLLSASSQAQPRPDPERCRETNNALAQVRDIREPHLGVITMQLKSGDYAAVEELFASAHASFRENPLFEAFMHKGFDLFIPEKKVDLELLNKWVEATGSAYAYTARGVFLAAKGFQARGKKLAKETTDPQFLSMEYYHREAMKDLMKAKELDPTISSTYSWLIQIAQTGQVDLLPEDVVREGLRNVPSSYYIRSRYLRSLLPRWGGSYEMMAVFAAEISDAADSNPRLWSLLGEIDADRAGYAFADKDYEKACRFYTAALQYGDRPEWLSYRAACYYQLGQPKQAAADLERLLYYVPDDLQARQWLSQLK